MSPEDIVVRGHRRSGCNFLAALIAKNFFSSDDTSPHLRGSVHGMPDRVTASTACVLYIRRDPQDVMESMFRFRHRLGLRSKSVEKFSETPYRSMIETTRGKVTAVKRSLDGRESRILGVGGSSLRRLSESPKKHHHRHVRKWMAYSRAHSNVHIVRYEVLVESDKPARLIEPFVGRKAKNYHLVPRVGWFPIGDIDHDVTACPIEESGGACC